MNAEYADKGQEAIGRDRRRQSFVAMGRLSPYLPHLCNLWLISPSYLQCL